MRLYVIGLYDVVPCFEVVAVLLLCWEAHGCFAGPSLFPSPLFLPLVSCCHMLCRFHFN